MNFDLELITTDNYDQVDEFDVIHIIDLPLNGINSIIKIISNISNNSSIFKHCIMSPKNLGYARTIKMLNEKNIKIIHLHSNTKLLLYIVMSSKFRGKIIHTIHASQASIMTNIADAIVCIHDTALALNRKHPRAIVIENTVDVARRSKEKPLPNNSFMVGARICEYYFNEENFDCYSKLKSDVHVYGFAHHKYSKMMEVYIESYKNVHKHPFNEAIEKEFNNYGGFLFFQPEKKRSPVICFGLTVMEAACYGMPIISMKRSQKDQKYIIHGYNGFLAENTEDFIRYANFLAKDKSIFEQFYKNAYNNSLRLKNTMPFKYEELYRELL